MDDGAVVGLAVQGLKRWDLGAVEKLNALRSHAWFESEGGKLGESSTYLN